MTTDDTTGRVKAPQAGSRLRLPEPAEREPNGNAHQLTQHPGNPDPRAIAVAWAVLESEGPEFAILFGSRARGDWDEESDIDLMLVTDDAPEDGQEDTCMELPEYRSLRPGNGATLRAEQAALESYGGPTPVHLVWITPEEYRAGRTYRNSLETVAVREGVIMERNPESHGRAEREFAEEQTEYRHDWTNYEERMKDAQGYRRALERALNDETADMDTEDGALGLAGERGVECAMKALLEAWQGATGRTESNRYSERHRMGELIGQVRRADPEMRDFRLQVDPSIYLGYAGRRAYTRKEPERMITRQERGLERTIEDIARLTARAEEVREATRQLEDQG